MTETPAPGKDRKWLEATVRAARDGDRAAFEALVGEFQNIAVAYATSILADYHLAEDVSQEAFAEAYRSLSALREPGAFAAWLRTIVFKYCDRIIRRRDYRPTGLDSAVSLASPEPSPLEAIETAEANAALHAAIGTLSLDEQQVVLLFYMGDHSQAAIAEFIGVTENAVKTRLYSARRRLRMHLEEIARKLATAKPSASTEFARKVMRLIQPEPLKRQTPWPWSPGIGTDIWEMFSACIAGDLAAVKALVARDGSLVRAHYEYRTPLSFAVRENQLAVAEFLLDSDAFSVGLGDPLEMARDRGFTAMAKLLERKMAQIHGASEKGEVVAAAIRGRDVKLVRQLLDQDPSLVNAGDRMSSQPIHWATMTRQLDIVDELLARGADINAQRSDSARPIMLTNGDYHYRGWRDVPFYVLTKPDDVYRHLVNRGAEVDIGMAAAKADIVRVRELLSRDPALANRVADYNSYYVGCGAPLKNAVLGGDIEIVKLLLAHGADPNLPEEGVAPNGHALYAAVSQDRVDMVELLLSHGAYPNPAVESSGDAIWIAIRDGNLKMVKLLAQHGAKWEIPIDSKRLSYEEIVAAGLPRTVEVLAYYGDTRAAAALFENDASLADDREALQSAASRGHEEFVQLLLRYQPNLARRVTVKHPRKIAELLFSRGMDPSLPNWMRITPLHHMAADGDVESAEFFLNHGADIHAREEEGRSTPLAWAAREGQARMVRFLLRRGAKIHLPDDPSWADPISWAARRGHDDVVRILRKHDRDSLVEGPNVAELETLAGDIVEAYSGTSDAARALDNVARYFKAERQLRWDNPTVEVQIERVRAAINARFEDPARKSLSRGDARELLARSEGFTSWAELIAHADSKT